MHKELQEIDTKTSSSSLTWVRYSEVLFTVEVTIRTDDEET